MKKTVLCIGLINAACAWGQSTPVDASAVESPKVIDGKTDDWTTGPLRYYDSNLKLSYDIANDRNNVYLVFQMDHELGTMQLLHSELQVELEPGGKNKRKAGIAFSDIKPPAKTDPASLDSTRVPKNREKGEPTLPAGFLKQAGLRFETGGFVSDNGTHTFSDTLPIRAAADMDALGNLTYELIIPLTQLAGDPATTSLLFSKKIDLGFSMVLFHRPGNGGAAHQNNDDIPGTPSGMGSGMNGMGGMGGSMQGPPGGMNGSNMGGMGNGQSPQNAGNFHGGERSDDGPSQSRESVKRKLQLKQL